MAFSYSPEFVEKIKTIPGHRWHPKEKHWSFKNSDGTLEKILKAFEFEGEEIQIDPVLQGTVPDLRTEQSEVVESGLSQPSKPVIARSPDKIGTTKQSQTHHASRITHHDFDNLKRELLSRKYSYRTVKGYLYYNRDFLNFIRKEMRDTSH